MKLKIGKVFLKYNPLIATGRNAFLLLVKTNLFGLGKKLNTLNKTEKGRQGLVKFWNKVGGNLKSLDKAITTAGRKGKHNFEEFCNFDAEFFDTDGIEHDSFEPITLSAAAVAAAPLIAQVLKLLKENGI